MMVIEKYLYILQCGGTMGFGIFEEEEDAKKTAKAFAESVGGGVEARIIRCPINKSGVGCGGVLVANQPKIMIEKE